MTDIREIELSIDLQVWMKVGWFQTALHRGVKASGWTGHPMQTNLSRAFRDWRDQVDIFLRVNSKTIVKWSGTTTQTLPFHEHLADIWFQIVRHQCRIFVSESSYDEW